MNVMAFYEDAASPYIECAHASAVRPLELQAVLAASGSPADLEAIDLGCGNGWYGRQMLAQGARRAVGVDLTPAMITAGRHASSALGDEMTFIQGDILDLQLDGQFDLAIASWVFCHAASRDELAGMYRSAAAVLKPGGQLIAVVNNPAYRLEDGDGAAYGARVLAQEVHPEADRLTVEVAGLSSEPVIDHQWSAPSHQAAAHAAGFGHLHWVHPYADAQAKEKAPAGFWAEYERNPLGIVLHCRT